MKIRFFAFIAFIINALTFSQLQAQTDGSCPFQRYDCIRGCGRYTDRNGDVICDFSLLTPAMRSKLLRYADSVEKARHPIQTVLPDTQKHKSAENPNLSKPTEKKEIKTQQVMVSQTETPSVTPTVSEPATNTPAIVAPAPQTTKATKTYNLLEFSIPLILLYLLTHFLSKNNRISCSLHRKIWNSLLLITFLVTGLFGLFLVVQINYNFRLDWFRTVLYWHVQFGIGMALISIFHVIWHLKYFTNIFKKARKNRKNC